MEFQRVRVWCEPNNKVKCEESFGEDYQKFSTIIGSTCLKGLRGYNSNYFGLYQQEW